MVYRCFFMDVFCSCSVWMNERQDMKNETGATVLSCPAKLCESEHPRWQRDRVVHGRLNIPN